MVVAAIIGFLFGFIGSMPVAGPIAALVFARALQGQVRQGLHIAIGGALAEAIYAALAFWGFAELLDRVPWLEAASNVAAALILAVLGIVFMRYRQSDALAPSETRGAHRGVLLGFTITALNPTLIATWAAASATLLSSGVVSLDSSHALPFSLGALVGIVVWFATLLRLVMHFRQRFSHEALSRVIRWMGGGLLLLSGWFAWRLIA